MTTEKIKGKRKRGEEGPDLTREKVDEAENLILSGDIAEQQEQDQPLPLIKKTNTRERAESGN